MDDGDGLNGPYFDILDSIIMENVSVIFDLLLAVIFTILMVNTADFIFRTTIREQFSI